MQLSVDRAIKWAQQILPGGTVMYQKGTPELHWQNDKYYLRCQFFEGTQEYKFRIAETQVAKFNRHGQPLPTYVGKPVFVPPALLATVLPTNHSSLV